MAYKKKELVANSLKILKDPTRNVLFWEELCVELGVSKHTFYNHKLHEKHEIKEALKANRVRAKSALRNKWFKSDNPALNLALYKLIGTDEERKVLSTNYQNHGGQNGENPIETASKVVLYMPDNSRGDADDSEDSRD